MPNYFKRTLYTDLSLLLTTGLAEACSSMEYSHRGNGSSEGAYYRLVNNCSYNVFFQFTAGKDSTGEPREYNVFWGQGRDDLMFVYGPLPKKYRTERSS